MTASYTPPPVTTEQLRAAGFTDHAMNHPRSEMGARYIASFNGVSFARIPAAWCYASNAYMLAATEQSALDALI